MQDWGKGFDALTKLWYVLCFLAVAGVVGLLVGAWHLVAWIAAHVKVV